MHIDLGVVFDQGLQLAIPERVPFRLTRELVDGMGVGGLNGPFARCAHETLRVLRSSPSRCHAARPAAESPVTAAAGAPCLAPVVGSHAAPALPPALCTS